MSDLEDIEDIFEVGRFMVILRTFISELMNIYQHVSLCVIITRVGYNFDISLACLLIRLKLSTS